MQITETSFDTSRNHIHIELIITTSNGIEYSVDGILDTGAPRTEFSDQFLLFTGFIEDVDGKVDIKQGLQTQKHNRLSLPTIEICGQKMNNFEVFVSRFEDSWGVDALIGLDFFRSFMVTVDYSKGLILTKRFNFEED